MDQFFSAIRYLAVGISLAFVGGASAQAQVLCPSTVPTQGGTVALVPSLNVCTNGTSGAFSNAALASQALTELSQSATQETTRTATNAISDRRQTEQQRCPEGFERDGGVCRRIAVEAAPSTTPAPRTAAPVAPKRSRSKQQPVVSAPRMPLYKAPPPVAVDQGPRFATWARVFGDFERRVGSATTPALSLALDGKSESSTVGGLAGVDVTARGLLSQGDGLIGGVLVGYNESNLTLTTTSTPSTPNVGIGAGTLKARVSGPSIGIYATYFDRGFSVDNTIKFDSLTLDENFNYLFEFRSIATPPAVGPQFVSLVGSGSTHLSNISSFGNINYKFLMSDAFWIEPTAGYTYTETRYDSDASLLGLADGRLLRLQGGARFGFESLWDAVRVTTILTGLVYNDVVVQGGVLQNGVFGTPNAPLLFPDQGKFRGLGALTLNLAFPGGFSSFVKAEVRGGQDLFAAGGMAGIRYQW